MKVAVSLLNAYSYCPRSVYLSEVLRLEPDSLAEMERGKFSQELRKRLLSKQTVLLGEAEDAGSVINALNEELDCAFDRLRRDYARLEDRTAEEVKSEVAADLGAFFDRLEYIAEDLGFEKALRRLTPWKVDYGVSSDRLGLSGSIDKVMKDSSYYPVEIKTCEPPESVWTGDRLQVCAYGMLLEEVLALKKKIPHGFVEYARILEMRPVMFTDSLRKNVNDTRNAVCALLAGDIPDICPHGNGRKCDSCGYAKKCYDI
jgi:CRISPR/Cas system-associated exonuclease Cas4 (RecB family)